MPKVKILYNTTKEFTGAEAKLKSYKAIYQLDSNDPKIIEKAIRNINNALDDPRLQGKLQIELITFSGGTEAYLKSSSKFEEPLKKTDPTWCYCSSVSQFFKRT